MSESRYRQALVDLAAADQGVNADKAEAAVQLVEAAASAGQPWAVEVLCRWHRNGATADYKRTVKALNPISATGRDGNRERSTAAYSRPVSDSETGTVGQQMRMVWNLTRNELSALIDDQDKQITRLQLGNEVVRALLAAMNAHPECATAGQAWQAAGHTLGEVDLGEAIAS